MSLLLIFYMLFLIFIRFSSAQLENMRFDFRPSVKLATTLLGYALLLSNKLISFSSDGQRQYDLL